MGDVSRADELTTKPGRSGGHEAAVDRLIELASDAKARPAPARALVIEEPKLADRGSMWKALAQLKAVLPYLSRLLPLLDARILPLLEMVGMAHPQNSAQLKELQEGVGGVQSGQRELRLALQSQAVEIKRLEDEVAQLREASMKTSHAQAGLIEDVHSVRSLVRLVGSGLVILLVVLIVMVGALLTRHGH
jgi:hypothetical protein